MQDPQQLLLQEKNLYADSVLFNSFINFLENNENISLHDIMTRWQVQHNQLERIFPTDSSHTPLVKNLDSLLHFIINHLRQNPTDLHFIVKTIQQAFPYILNSENYRIFISTLIKKMNLFSLSLPFPLEVVNCLFQKSAISEEFRFTTILNNPLEVAAIVDLLNFDLEFSEKTKQVIGTPIRKIAKIFPQLAHAPAANTLLDDDDDNEEYFNLHFLKLLNNLRDLKGTLNNTTCSSDVEKCLYLNELIRQQFHSLKGFGSVDILSRNDFRDLFLNLNPHLRREYPPGSQLNFATVNSEYQEARKSAQKILERQAAFYRDEAKILFLINFVKSNPTNSKLISLELQRQLCGLEIYNSESFVRDFLTKAEEETLASHLTFVSAAYRLWDISRGSITLEDKNNCLVQLQELNTEGKQALNEVLTTFEGLTSTTGLVGEIVANFVSTTPDNLLAEVETTYDLLSHKNELNELLRTATKAINQEYLQKNKSSWRKISFLDYLCPSNRSHLKLLSTLFDKYTGKNRANFYFHQLESPATKLQHKVLFLIALLSSKEGPTLKTSVMNAIKTARNETSSNMEAKQMADYVFDLAVKAGVLDKHHQQLLNNTVKTISTYSDSLRAENADTNSLPDIVMSAF